MNSTVNESTFSFDFDYNGMGPEDLDQTHNMKNASMGQIKPSGLSALFDFPYNLPLDSSKSDLIFPDQVLDDATIGKCISTVGPVITTFKRAYTKFEARNKQLIDISLLSKYIHLRIVDLADNHLKDLGALLPLSYLQVLNAEGNKVADMTRVPKFPFLQALNLANNDILYTKGFQPNKLTYLSLATNHIKTLDGMTGENFPNLLVLQLQNNNLVSLRGLEMPKLENLFVANNMLKDLDGIVDCPNLKIIHARHNQIYKLVNFPCFEQLEYINLRHNKMNQFSQVKELGNAKTLKTVVLSDNPISQVERYRLETIAACPPSLKRLDKLLLSETEQVDAVSLRIERRKNPLADDPNVMSFQSESPLIDTLHKPEDYPILEE